MYLKSIEVIGFKSFANKIDFEFHNGITCIVGPNGSGKSNVADAVRWVLGEQSAKQLRGASMSDVIFSGTELRKPQGFASVAITLDNSDHRLPVSYEEVTVSRKVFRSGESEYKINGVVTRLKDIQELFYDTGIGKEGYSIIGQGQIDKILSNKPDERRELFDEAVGIVKFKRRKKDTLKKLDNVHLNLQRVKDILFELEKQVGPLQRQSENARKYLALRDELKVFDFQLFTLDYENGEKKLKEIGDNLSIVLGHIEETTKDNELLSSEYEEVNTAMSELDNLISEARQRQMEESTKFSQTSGEILVLKEQINSENTNLTHINERIDAISSENDRYHLELKELDEALVKNGEKEYDLVNSEYDCTNTLAALDIRIEKHEKKVSESKNKLLSLLNEKTDAASKLEHFSTLESQQLIRRGEISSRILRLNSDHEKYEGILAIKKQDENDNNLLISEQRTEIKNKLTEKNNLYDRLENEKNSFRENQQAKSIAESRAEHLKGLEERYEGYQMSIRKVMERSKEKHLNILGVISDLIHVEKKYETAIEIALGGAIQNVVSADTKTAKELIAYLKEGRFGRATFLPLDAFNKDVSFPQRDALKEKGSLGVATELVSFDDRLKYVLGHLLGRTLIVDNFDNANSIARKYNFSLRIVTLDGELFSPGGSLTGGAFKNNNNLLGRKREIEELEKAAKAAFEKMQASNKNIPVLQSKYDKALKSLDELNRQLQDMLIKQREISVVISQTEEKLKGIRVELADASAENKQMENELSKLRLEKETMTDSLRSIEEENSDSEKNISDDESRLLQEKERREALSVELSEARIQLSRNSQEKEYLIQNKDRIDGELERLALEKQTLLSRKNTSSASIKELNSKITDVEKAKTDAEENVRLFTDELNRLNNERNDFASKQKIFFTKQQEISTRQRELDMEKLRLENQEEKVEEHQSAMVDYLWSEWEITPADAIVDISTVELSLTELKKNVAHIKNSIKGLGNINVNSIEEYKEVSERYEFMKGQCDDLNQAENTLNNIIDELDTGMRKQFNEQFAKIQTEFNIVFRELFGGGSGKLELVEDEDVIEAGIRIISQPPGKKLQNMMQLSGGEKALTAIALLFAIQNLKPSPFCLLDEIEAALDDSNVTRFAQYLHKLTENTQFIVISHRRGTMVAADRLYGITMMEKGVSSLVSVNMVEKDLDA